MNINDLTIKQIQELTALIQAPTSPTYAPWEIGKIYLIRTVTMINTGRLVEVHQQELVLEDAAWIADTGRFANALDKAEFNEVEPFPKGTRVIIGRGSIIDAVQIKSVQLVQK